MTDHQFDQFFKDRLGNHSSPVPGDMWQRINEKKKDKPLGFFFWLGAGLLLLAFSTAGYLLLQSGKTNQKALASSTTSSKKISVTAENSKDKPLALVASVNPPLATAGKTTKEKSTINKKQVNGSIKKAIHSTNQSLQKNSPAAKQVFALADHLLSNHQNEQAASIASMEKNLPLQSGSVYLDSNNVNTRTLDKDNSETANTFLLKSDTPVPTVTAAINNDSSSPAVNKTIQVKEKKSMQKHRFTADIYISPDIAFKHSSTTNLTGLMLAQQSKQATNQLLSYSLGVRLGLSLSKHFSVKSGLQYSQVNEQFVYTDYNATRVIPLVTERTFTSINGANTISYDTTSLLQAGIRKITTYNHYRSIDIPLLVGYETGNENLNLYVNAGPVVNLYSWYSGTTLNSSLQPETIASSGIYKSNIGLSLYLGLGVSKKINKQWQLFGEPYFRYQLSSMTSSSIPYQQKIHTAGVQLGVRYKF